MSKSKDEASDFGSSDCSLAWTPEEQAELDELLETWIPFHRKPRSPDEWDKLVSQRYGFAVSAKECHEGSVSTKAPLFLRQMLAKSKYETARRYWRVKRRASSEKQRLCENLLHALGLRLAD